jgi:molecular chaperone GrpE
MSKDNQKAKEEEVKDKDLEQNVDQNQQENQEGSEGKSEKEQEEELSVEDKLKAELSAEKDKFLRLFAEFENYKRRTSKQQLDLIKTANSELMLSLLPVLDDFDRAMGQIESSEDTALVEGIKLIQNKLKDTLSSKNLSEVKVEAGAEFDSDIHDAITQIPAPSEDLKGKIIDVVEKGYILGDRVIRHPKVVVGIK